MSEFPTGFWYMVGIGLTIAGAVAVEWIIGFYNEGEQNDE